MQHYIKTKKNCNVNVTKWLVYIKQMGNKLQNHLKQTQSCNKKSLQANIIVHTLSKPLLAYTNFRNLKYCTWNTVKPVFFVCLLFSEFHNLGDFVKITGRKTNSQNYGFYSM